MESRENIKVGKVFSYKAEDSGPCSNKGECFNRKERAFFFFSFLHHAKGPGFNVL